MRVLKFVLLIFISFVLTACFDENTLVIEDSKNYIALESPYYYNLNTKEIRSIEITPMEDWVLHFIQGNYAFFSENGNYQGLKLKALNLDTYEIKNVYSAGNLYDYDGLLGLDMLFPTLSETEYNSQLIRLNNNSWFFDNCIYSYKKQYLQCLNLTDGKISLVYEQLNISEVLLSHNNVYIVDNENNLYLSDIACTKLELLCKDFRCEGFLLYDKLVYYMSYNDTNKIYKLGTSEPFYICDSTLILRYITKDYLIVWNEADDSIYYSKHDNADFKLISKNPSAEIIYADSEYIYFYNGESVFVMDYEGEIIKI